MLKIHLKKEQEKRKEKHTEKAEQIYWRLSVRTEPTYNTGVTKSQFYMHFGQEQITHFQSG